VSDEHDNPKESRRRRVARSLVETASQLVTRGRMAAQKGAEGGESRPAAVADAVFMDAQQAAYHQIYRRFTERARAGEGGLASAMEALDAMWQNVRHLRAGAPAILLTLSNAEVSDRRQRFYHESTQLLEDAIREVFKADLGNLAVPPERMALLVRVVLEGLVVELAQAQTADDVARVDQAYADLRRLFEGFVLMGDAAPQPITELVLEPIPLPW
jgi:hypothetical protein